MAADPDVPNGFDDRLLQRSATHPLQTYPPVSHIRGTIPNTPLAVSTVAFLLGGVFSLGLLLFLVGGLRDHWWATWQLGFFLAAFAIFHWGEFAATAGWNLEKCGVDSFLLDNGAHYNIANGAAIVEYLLILYFKPSVKAHPYISLVGVVPVVLGQVFRTYAMIHASTNFSHVVAHQRRLNHELVTDGVYAWSRHPSYAGFFYRAIGTQLVLQNPLSFLVYVVVLWMFFYRRIRDEERSLVRFFGQDYINYRKRVGTLIPFIP